MKRREAVEIGGNISSSQVAENRTQGSQNLPMDSENSQESREDTEIEGQNRDGQRTSIDGRRGQQGVDLTGELNGEQQNQNGT